MATRIFLIRHGETEGFESRRYKGHIDVPLSANGVEQVRRTAAFMAESIGVSSQHALTTVYCSDLIRAVRSAEIIAEPFGLKPVIEAELKERGFGEWEGMTFEEIEEKWPEAFRAWADNPLEFSPLKGESTLDVKTRALSIFTKIIARHKDENIAIVAHGGINRVMLCEFLGVPLQNIFRIEQDFAALNEIEIWDYPVIKTLNRTF
ncbi:MAG: histidine phosphatase family protein [Nitrospira sp.]|nr:histidine phosphatase family protein [Nitrospira sp.]